MATAATTTDDSPCGMIKAERSGRLPTKRSVQAVPLCGSILLPMARQTASTVELGEDLLDGVEVG